jgi:ribosomal protein S12 methylthiotransferase accessory factor YcaO
MKDWQGCAVFHLTQLRDGALRDTVKFVGIGAVRAAAFCAAQAEALERELAQYRAAGLSDVPPYVASFGDSGVA